MVSIILNNAFIQLFVFNFYRKKDKIIKKVDQIELNQGERWIKNEIAVRNSMQSTLRLIFQSIRGFDRSNKMGLDDITFTDEPCQSLPS